MSNLSLLVLAASRAIAEFPLGRDTALASLWVRVFAGALLAGISATESTPSFAQAGAPIDRDYSAVELVPLSQRVERKIAFAKSELKLTPEQEARWEPVAAAMRDNAEALDRMMLIARQERLAMGEARGDALRADFQRVQHENETRLAGALKPLYRSLSPAQKDVAGTLFVGFHGAP
jgi:hypothetical protein